MPRTLLYIASGPYKPIYEKLPYDRVILVDSEFTGERPPYSSKVRLMEMDALVAIRQLRKDGVQIHAFVSLNEGLDEGGGFYPIFSDEVLGYLSPILADSVVVVLDRFNHPEKLRGIPRAWNFGFKVERILPNHHLFMEPGIFSFQGKNDICGQVFLLRRKLNITPVPNRSKLSIKLVHGSIWQNEDQLDMIGINLRARTKRFQKELLNDFFLSDNRVVNIYGKSFSEIIELSEARKTGRLGLTPWKKGDYKEVFDCLNCLRVTYLREITFYHLNIGDYKDLYRISLKSAS